MSAELIATLAVGGVLGSAMLATMRGLRVEIGDLRSEVRGVRSEVRDLRSGVGELRERMARLEALLVGSKAGGREGSAV